MKKLLLGLSLFLLSFSLIAQTELCTDTYALYVFQHNNKNYAIVKDAKSWTDAIASYGISPAFCIFYNGVIFIVVLKDVECISVCTQFGLSN